VKKKRERAGDDASECPPSHYMKCPKCGMDLLEIDYRGIKIDRRRECEDVYGSIPANSRPCSLM
jgi:hypothetical protein